MIRSNASFFHRILHWRYLALVNMLLVLLIACSFGRELLRRRDIDTQIHLLQAQAQSMQTQNTALLELHNAVQTESYIEREARLKLGLKKPGETLVILTGAKGMGDRAQGTVADPLGIVADESGMKKPLANSTKWWYYFFNKQLYREEK